MNADEKELSAILRIEGGTADDGLLDIHDAATTRYGLARAVNIVLHAFLNKEYVRTKAQNAHGAQAMIKASTKGCFEEIVQITFDGERDLPVPRSALPKVFWDYLTCCWSAAAGIEAEPETPYFQSILKQKDHFLDEISDALEKPMRNVHRSIAQDPNVRIYLNRPYKNDVLTFDTETLDHVESQEVDRNSQMILGNVTRFNVLSPYGRLYSKKEGRVIPFKMQDFTNEGAKKLALASMREVVEGKEGRLRFTVFAVRNGRGVVKRYLVEAIQA